MIDRVLAGYEGGKVGKNVVMVGNGTGGLSELVSNEQSDKIMYGLWRTTDVYEGVCVRKSASMSESFCVLVWMTPERVHTPRVWPTAQHSERGLRYN